MINTKQRWFLLGLFFVYNGVQAMGLRSFVALPVEKHGAVVRVSYESNQSTNIDSITPSAAYGLDAKQTLLFGLPYQVSPSISNANKDISILYRNIVSQQDSNNKTKRFALLAGAVLPTVSNRDKALQAGFVYTLFNKRNEFDVDLLYQAGQQTRLDAARFDASWQHRLLPIVRPDWGITTELNSVLELNGRWQENNSTTYQVTTGVQWIHQKLVLESGLAFDINNNKETRFIVSARFHL